MKKIMFFLVMIMFSAYVYANAAPTIDTVSVNATNYDPLEGGLTYVEVDFNVTDTDGIANLNNSLCSCRFFNASTWTGTYQTAVNTSCANATVDADTMQYTCTIPMYYWYQATTYSVNITIKDNTSWVNRTNSTFTYNVLAASVLDTSTVSFGLLTSANYNTNVTDANSPLTINNTGNKQLSINVTGAELSDSNSVAPNISVSRYYVDTDNTAAEAMPLTASTQSIIGSVLPAANSTGSGLEELWWFFSMPSVLQYGLYSGIWTLLES